jgi:predicted nucleotidyltransferase
LRTRRLQSLRVGLFQFVPNSGMILPVMGKKRAPSSPGLAGALFSPVQQRVLGLLFGQPGRRFQSGELIRLANSGTGAVHRQLSRLEAAGWVTVARVGNQKYYQANADSPAFEELRGLIAKTVGLVEPLRRALEPVAESIEAAFVYGSIAKGVDTASSDIDILVIGSDIGYDEIFAALQTAEATLNRSVNPNVMTPREWRTERRETDSFVARIAAQPRLFLIGSDDDLG